MQNLIVLTDQDRFPFDVDDARLASALSGAGISFTCQDWTKYAPAPGDQVLVRTIWNYTKYPAQFLKMLDELEANKCRVANPLSVLRWNSDKTYLVELFQRGLPVIPTNVIAAFQPDEMSFSGQSLIVKPAIGSSGIHAFLIESEKDWSKTAVLTGQKVIVQPFLDSVINSGEVSFIFFGNVFSHAVLKFPATKDFRVHEEHGGTSRPYQPSAKQIETAQKFLEATPNRSAYARVDMIVSGADLLLVELELIEPSFYFKYFDGSPELRFAEAVKNYFR